MQQLLTFLRSMPVPEREAFARRCQTSAAYLRKAISVNAKLGEGLCINLERESRGAVMCEDLRPDVDWAYLRNSGPVRPRRQIRAVDSDLAALHPTQCQETADD